MINPTSATFMSTLANVISKAEPEKSANLSTEKHPHATMVLAVLDINANIPT